MMKPIVKTKFVLATICLLVTFANSVGSAPLPRIVILSLSAPADQMQAFEEGLRARGLIHGSTIELTHITASGLIKNLKTKAQEAASQSPDVIVAVGSKAAIAAQKSTTEIPIVAVTGDMGSIGLVKNFNQPEGNVTGFSFFTIDLAVKRIDILLQVNPALRRLKIIMPANMHGVQLKVIAQLDEVLTPRGIDTEVLRVSNFDELEATIANIDSSPEESLYLHPSVIFDSRARDIGSMLDKHRVVAMLPWREYVEGGGLMSYSPDIIGIWREASDYAERVLRGATLSELPVVQPTLFELVINLQSARKLGITVPRSVLLTADDVIE